MKEDSHNKDTFNDETAIPMPNEQVHESNKQLSAIDRLRNENKGGDGNGSKSKFNQIDRTDVIKNN